MPPEATHKSSRRVRREKQTLALMIHMFCAQNHTGFGALSPVGQNAALCEQCASLRAYAEKRVEQCVFGDGKPTCARCTVHCFRSDMREEIRRIMRFAGPRMTFRHPHLAIRHLLDRRRSPNARAAVPTTASSMEDNSAD